MVPSATIFMMATCRSGAAGRARAAATRCVLVLAILAGGALQPAWSTERIISDPDTRLALFGYDPVAYQADGEARPGVETYELIYRRLVWRFANQGNHDAFSDDPERYIPAYGGHDPFAITRGAALTGHPEIFVEIGGRIFLFHSRANLIAFLMEADFHLAEADLKWPDVRQTLAP